MKLLRNYATATDCQRSIMQVTLRTDMFWMQANKRLPRKSLWHFAFSNRWRLIPRSKPDSNSTRDSSQISSVFTVCRQHFIFFSAKVAEIETVWHESDCVRNFNLSVINSWCSDLDQRESIEITNARHQPGYAQDLGHYATSLAPLQGCQSTLYHNIRCLSLLEFLRNSQNLQTPR